MDTAKGIEKHRRSIRVIIRVIKRVAKTKGKMANKNKKYLSQQNLTKNNPTTIMTLLIKGLY